MSIISMPYPFTRIYLFSLINSFSIQKNSEILKKNFIGAIEHNGSGAVLCDGKVRRGAELRPFFKIFG